MKLVIVIFAFVELTVQAISGPGSHWTQTVWNGENAWESTANGWTAVVSAERARLVSIAESPGGDNLLYAPPKNQITWGGHRCWLGPQSHWKKDWPPLADWEASAPANINVEGDLIRISHPHTDQTYPALERSYQWKDGVLHSIVSWNGGDYHAIHILQLPRWAIVHLRSFPRTDLPLGYGIPRVSRAADTLTTVEIEKGIARRAGNSLTIWHANVIEKIAFEPQEIVAEIGKYHLKFGRGVEALPKSVAPNLGLMTQVYVGDWERPFVEVEQLSAFMSGGRAEFEVLIEPICVK